MSPKSRHLYSAGVLFSALAFAGATYAQSSGTSTSSDRAASAPSTNSQSASSGSASTNTSSNRSSSAAGSASTDSSTTATPPASAAAGSSGSAAASGASDRADTKRSQAGTSSTESTAGTTGASSSTGASAASQGHALRASKVIGADVENANGDDIGEIKDLVIDTQSENVRYVVLSHGGILGIGDKLFAYPMSKVQTQRGDDDQIVMDVSKDKLENAPGFDKDKWPDFADATYTSEIDRYYGAESRARADGEKPAHVVRASELIGKNFDDRQGNDAGEIDDLIVDSSTGRVHFAIVDLDDDWNKQADGKLVAIPLKEFAMSGEDNDKLVIQSSSDAIDTSRAFSRNEWPKLDDPMWRTSSAPASATSQRSDASGTTTPRSDVASNLATQDRPGSAMPNRDGATAGTAQR